MQSNNIPISLPPNIQAQSVPIFVTGQSVSHIPRNRIISDLERAAGAALAIEVRQEPKYVKEEHISSAGRAR